MTGEELVAAAKRLILEELRRAPEGLSNVEVGRRTGLHVELPKQSGYIQWTLLQELMLEGKVRKQGAGPGARYFVE